MVLIVTDIGAGQCYFVPLQRRSGHWAAREFEARLLGPKQTYLLNWKMSMIGGCYHIIDKVHDTVLVQYKAEFTLTSRLLSWSGCDAG